MSHWGHYNLSPYSGTGRGRAGAREGLFARAVVFGDGVGEGLIFSVS
jgi:hypothetical protein